MENQKKQSYEERPGTISIFTNNSYKDPISHNFYGSLLSLDGEIRKIQLYTKTSNDGKIFLMGNVADSNELIREMLSEINKDQKNSIVLFINEKYAGRENAEKWNKEQPYYTGFYIDNFGNKLQISLWKKISKFSKISFFSGKISEKSTF